MLTPIEQRLEDLRQEYALEKKRGGNKLWLIELKAKVLKVGESKFAHQVQKELIYGR